VECSEPLVEGEVVFPVVAFEVAVVQLVEERGGGDTPFAYDQGFLEADVTLGWWNAACCAFSSMWIG
jgi:hypothetical protein